MICWKGTGERPSSRAADGLSCDHNGQTDLSCIPRDGTWRLLAKQSRGGDRRRAGTPQCGWNSLDATDRSVLSLRAGPPISGLPTRNPSGGIDRTGYSGAAGRPTAQVISNPSPMPVVLSMYRIQEGLNRKSRLCVIASRNVAPRSKRRQKSALTRRRASSLMIDTSPRICSPRISRQRSVGIETAMPTRGSREMCSLCAHRGDENQ
jgi:hypothetical protein